MKFNKKHDIDYPLGFSAASTNSGLKKKGVDSALLLCRDGAVWAGVISQNRFRSSSLDDALKKKSNLIKALIVYSKNANAGTGEHGEETDRAVSTALAMELGISAGSILMSYTGVVGWPFPYEGVIKKLPQLVAATREYSIESKKIESFSSGIMTTDTFPKRHAIEIKTDSGSVRLAGCAKGAGMIYPNMATMLSYITTDIDISRRELSILIRDAVGSSFNRISVDGDTSTNDSFFALASGKSGVKYSSCREQFRDAFIQLAQLLAKDIVRDGEGATTFITLNVTNAKTIKVADKVARTVANSLLLKTAVFGGDPNYGRILVAIGAAGVKINTKKVSISFGDIKLFDTNKVHIKNLKRAAKYLKKKEISINISLGDGNKSATFWSCDISYDYVKINAEYTT